MIIFNNIKNTLNNSLKKYIKNLPEYSLLNNYIYEKRNKSNRKKAVKKFLDKTR